MPLNARPTRALAPLLPLVLACCAKQASDPAGEAPLALPKLPVSISNNAVAGVGDGVFSFNGLLAGKTWRDATDRAFEFNPRNGRWQEIEPVPGGVGRLASTAQSVGGAVFIFGGYTVAEDGAEASTPEVYRFDPESSDYRALPDMPVPVDDAVSGVYRDRYVYLVSGWNDTDNVANVQVLDTETESWLQATPLPGAPLFGHAGGLVDGKLVICDGVKVVPAQEPDAQRRFVISDACHLGFIDRVDPSRIDWKAIPPHPGKPLYRAAGCGAIVDGVPRVVIAAGTTNPYNYDGIGYDGVASDPNPLVVGFDLDAGRWLEYPPLPRATMDHRNLVRLRDGFAIVGGMGMGQRVLSSSQRFELL